MILFCKLINDIDSQINQKNGKTNKQKMMNNIARMINYRLHAEQLFIPVLSDF